MSFVDLASPSARLHKPVGDLRPREDSRYLSTPRLWIFPPSINSGKAHVALCASSCTDFTVETVGVVGANYRPEYALLNPLMTVPTLEIDDVIINDSHEIVRYLRKHRPAAGTTDSAEVQSFVALVESWDEGLWNYGTLEGRVSSAAELSNEARIYYLRKYRAQVAHRKGIDPGRLALLTAYDAKIAAVGKLAAATAAASRDQAGHLGHRPWPDARP